MDKLKLGWAGAAAKVITENTGKEVTAEDVAVKATVAVNNKKFGADLFVSVAKDVLKKGTPSARFGTAPRKLGVGTETSGPDVAFYGDPNDRDLTRVLHLLRHMHAQVPLGIG